MHTAIVRRNIKIITLLLENIKINANILTDENDNSLQLAIKCENLEIIEILLEKGQVKAESKEKQAILDLLDKKGKNEKIIQLIS